MASITEIPGARAPWAVRWRAEGRHRSRQFRTRRQAERFRATIEDEQALGAHAPREASRDTLDTWLDTWLATYATRWAASTGAQRADVIDRHIRPHLGGVRLRDLGPDRIARFQIDLTHAGATPKTVNAVIRVLSAALGTARTARLIPSNPCQGTPPLPARKPDRRAIPVDVIERIRAGMLLPRDRAIVSLMAYAGLRPGEVCGLRWQDIQTRTIHIVQSYTVADGVHGTKTGAARTIPIERPVRDDIAALTRGEGLVVTGERGGPIHWKNWSRRVWAPARGDTDYVPYECRHSYASLLIASGLDIIEVQDRMGHASATTTFAHYAHLVRDHKGARNQRLETRVKRARAHAEPFARRTSSSDRPR